MGLVPENLAENLPGNFESYNQNLGSVKPYGQA